MLKESQSRVLHALPHVCLNDSTCHYIGACQRLVMCARFTFCRGGDDGARQQLVFLQSIGKVVPVDLSCSVAILVPQRCSGGPSNDSAYNNFNSQRSGGVTNRCIWVWATNEMVIDNVSRIFEPPCRKLVQHLTLIRNNRHYTVKGRQPISRKKESCVVVE